MNEPTGGEQIALRRNRLGWKQSVLAEHAGVSLNTVVSIEKDRGVRTESLKVVLAALDKAEKKKRPGPPVSTPPATVEPSKEGADAATRIRIADARLERIERWLADTLEDVRRTRTDLAGDSSEDRRKRG